MKKKKSDSAYRPPGEFRMSNLARVVQKQTQDEQRVRWRTLCKKGEKSIRVYAAVVPILGFRGYTKEALKLAPCTHCGATGMCALPHLCKGVYSHGGPCAYDGERLKDGRHVCAGEPSMSWHGTLSWLAVDGWKEE